MKLSIIVPVYCNEDTLNNLYIDIKNKIIDIIDYEYELIFINDGSRDSSYYIMQKLKKMDCNIKIYSLSRNFGSHAAVLCGLKKCTGDCAVVKAADLQEPSELILDMVNKWKEGNNVVLATRKSREEGKGKVFFANLYYWLVRKFALPSMPKKGFDIFLIDKKVIKVLSLLDERNSSITAQIIWSGFTTAEVPYIRKGRTIGTSKWTLKKKIRLVTDTLFGFSNVPLNVISFTGIITVAGSLSAFFLTMILYIMDKVSDINYALLFEFIFFIFGMLSCFQAILGEYIWRDLDASRNRPVYIIEESEEDHYENTTK